MIVYNEKIDDQSGGSNSQQPAPTVPSTPQSAATTGSPRPGLLHQYLQRHLNSAEPLRRSSGDTDDEGQDHPPPYTASLADFPVPTKHEELSKLLSHSCPPFSYSAINSPCNPTSSQYAAQPPPGEPIAGPSTLPSVHHQSQIGDLEGTWILSSDEDAVCPPAEYQAAVRSTCRTRNLRTQSGDIRGSIIIEGHATNRCTFEAVTGLGSIDINVTRNPLQSQAKLSIKVKSERRGTISLNLPSDFCGPVRVARPFSLHPPPVQINTSYTTLVSDQTDISSSEVEYFVGDAVAAGYVKGMTAEEWRGDIVEAEAWDGEVSIHVASQHNDLFQTFLATLRPVLDYFWSFCEPWWHHS